MGFQLPFPQLVSLPDFRSINSIILVKNSSNSQSTSILSPQAPFWRFATRLRSCSNIFLSSISWHQFWRLWAGDTGWVVVHPTYGFLPFLEAEDVIIIEQEGQKSSIYNIINCLRELHLKCSWEGNRVNMERDVMSELFSTPPRKLTWQWKHNNLKMYISYLHLLLTMVIFQLVMLVLPGV